MDRISRAATLGERLPALDRTRPVPEPADDLLRRWREVAAGGDPDRFAQRLAGLAIDHDDVARLAVTTAPSPAWATTVDAAVAAARCLARVLDPADDAAWKPDAELAYASLWRPWVTVASQRARAMLTAGHHPLIDELQATLLARLTGLGERVAHESFVSAGPHDAGTGPYRRWVRAQLAGGCDPLFEQYPVLARLLAIASDQWVAASVELCLRLAADREAIERELGVPADERVVRVEALGDPHQAGRQVMVLCTEGGASFVYKPRSLEPERAFATAAAHLLELGAVDVPLTPRTVVRDGYGWTEFVHAAPCRDARELVTFSRRAGAAVALAHALAVTDLHLENVVAAGDRPVLIDLECIASAPLRDEGVTGLPTPLAFVQSVLSTCLLPTRDQDRPLAVDIAGLTATAAQVSGDTARVWEAIGTGAIRVARRPADVWSTVPRPDGTSTPPVDLDALLDGLDTALRAIATGGLGLDLAEVHEHRVVLRDTQGYATVLAAAIAPEHLRDGMRFSIELDAVAADAYADDAGAWRRTVAELERESLASLDVPLATGRWDEVALHLAGATVDDVLVAPGTDVVRAVLASLDESGISLQRSIAQISLEVRLGRPARPARRDLDTSTAPDGGALAAALAIGAHLAATAVDAGDGSVQWLNAIVQHDEHVAGGLGGPGLYTGSAGVAVFLAGLAHVTGEARWDALARRALAATERLDGGTPDPDLAEGLAGAAYAASLVAGLLDDRTLAAPARDRLLGALERAELPDDVDLMTGSGGIVLALGAVAGDDGRTRDAARRHARMLHDRWHAQRARGFVERNRADRLGTAHGSGGTTLALARVLALGDDATLRRWLDDLLDAEDERIDRRDGVPARVTPDARRTADTSWCWGTVGFALGRRAIHDVIGRRAATHLARADELNVTAPDVLHRLCCGAAGTLEALAEVSSPAATERRAALRDLLVSSVGAHVLEDGTSFQSASLFRGIAGTGYALLRTVDEQLPCVLSFAPVGS